MPAALVLADSGQNVAALLARLAGALRALAWRPAGVVLPAAAGAVPAALLQRSLLPSRGNAMAVCCRRRWLLGKICAGIVTDHSSITTSGKARDSVFSGWSDRGVVHSGSCDWLSVGECS